MKRACIHSIIVLYYINKICLSKGNVCSWSLYFVTWFSPKSETYNLKNTVNAIINMLVVCFEGSDSFSSVFKTTARSIESKAFFLYLMLLVSPVSGSSALTRPTVQAGGQFSDTSMWYRVWENLGGSSASSTATWMDARSLNGPLRRKRGSTIGFSTSTEKE